MTNSEKDGLNKQATGNEVRGKEDIYEDEINLIDDFKVFWKRKHFIILVSRSVGISCWYRFFSHLKIIKQLMFQC